MWERYAERLVAPLLLRLGLAAIFIYHGQQLVSQAWGTGWGPPQMPVPVKALVAWGELLGGIAMLLGFLTRVAAVGLAIIMVGAIATVHWPHGFSAPQGWEYNYLIIIVCAALLLWGGGVASVDQVLWRRKRTWRDRIGFPRWS